MRVFKTVLLLFLLVTFGFCFSSDVYATDSDSLTTIRIEKSNPVKMNLSGPRYGITTIPGGTEIAKELEDRDLDLTFSQFGWQFEYNAVPTSGDLDFMVEIVGLLGGSEMGVILPSLTGLIGVRTLDGFEFGVGPNLSITGASLCAAVGKAFEYGGIRIPVNLSYVKGPDGVRISIVTGFAVDIDDVE